MIETILLQAADGGGYTQLILFGGIALVFYFFMIRPQQKKQKEQKKFLQEIKKGDQIVTIGGIHGKVLSVDDATVVLEIDKGVKITIQKSSVSLEASQTPEEKKK